MINIAHQFPYAHFPIATNNRSPISPNPGTIIPLSSHLTSTPATQTSTPPSQLSCTLLTPSSDASTLIIITRFTPHSRNRWMAASAVAPVAMMGSSRMAVSAAAMLVAVGVGFVVEVSRW